jgi:hypothetical protein
LIVCRNDLKKIYLQLRAQLQEMLLDLDNEIHEPYFTTKHGQLRSKHKAKTEPISAVDDLATLDNLEEVCMELYISDNYCVVFFTWLNKVMLYLLMLQMCAT